MARQRSSRNDSILDGCFGIFEMLPPWMCLPGAAVAFFIPTYLLGRVSIPGVKGQPFLQIGMALGGLSAIACLFGGFRSWKKRQRQQSFVGEQVDTGWVERLSWQEFEQQLAAVYRQEGYRVEECGGSGPDGGVDLRLTRGTERVLVQCKHWKSWKVGAPVVRELYGVQVAEGATKSILITSGDISREAFAFAEGKPMELVNGDDLQVLLRRFQRDLATSLGKVAPEPPKVVKAESASAPACPNCGGNMVLRVARKGANAGEEFWGCQQYPRCKGIRAT